MAKLELYKRMILKNNKGDVVFDSGQIKSNSFAIAFLEHVYGAFSDTTFSIVDTGNSSRDVLKDIIWPPAPARPRLNVDGPVSNASYGIVVGTGTTSESNTDHALATQIAHGTGSGQLQHGSTSFVVPSELSGNIDLVVSRTFTNGSGASITVNEIGIYCQSYGTGDASHYFCIVRDVLSTPVAVSNGLTLTVQYTLRTTV